MKSLKEYYNNYLTKIEKEREDYTTHTSVVPIIKKSIEYIFGAFIIMLLLLGNVLDTEPLKELYSGVGFVLYVLVFSWIVINWSKTLFNKVNEWDLGIRKDSILIVLLISLNFMFIMISMVMLGGSTDPIYIGTMLDYINNLNNLLMLLITISVAVLVIRSSFALRLFFGADKNK